MKKLFLISVLVLFSINCYSENSQERISAIEDVLSKSINKDLFSVKTDKNKPNLIRIELAPALNDEYKDSLHLWFVDNAKTNPLLNNIFLTRQQKPSLFTQANLISGSLTILLLLIFLYFSLKILSLKKSPQTVEDYEDILTKKIEEKVENMMSKPSRTIDYL